MSGSTTSSSLPFTFTELDEADLAIKSDNRCSICGMAIYKGGVQEYRSGKAARYIAASETKAREMVSCIKVELLSNAYIPQLNVALTYNIVSQNGPQDPEEALGVSVAQVNGIWRV